ncbi:HEAT repeat domain-containing protein [Candidatus Poribacteria bacterium]|nr:HEAT repeat domain-containing protein [Candidatus Poribacteria bacterium]
MKGKIREITAILLCFIFLTATLAILGCGAQNEHLAKGKELLKSNKRRKEERAVAEFKLAVKEEPDNAEAHYLIGYYDENATVQERGEHLYLAYKNDKRKYLDVLIYETLRVNDQNLIQATLYALRKAYKTGGQKEVLKKLLEGIKSKDSRDRYDAGLALAYIGDKKDGDPDRVVPELIKLLDHKRMGTRLNAVLALGEIGDERAVNPIYQKIILITDEKNKENPEVRRLAVEALGKIGTKSAMDKLVEIIQDKGSSLRVDAIEILAKIAGQDVVPILTHILGEKGAREVKVKL